MNASETAISTSESGEGKHLPMDSVSSHRRSEIMALVRSKDSRPEMVVRRFVHRMGFRYRLHAANLPGKPDLVFPSRKKIIFVHGCFWHRHENCPLARIPKSRQAFWIDKLNRNRDRDTRIQKELGQAGWQVLTLWECEIKNNVILGEKIKDFLGAQP